MCIRDSLRQVALVRQKKKRMNLLQNVEMKEGEESPPKVRMVSKNANKDLLLTVAKLSLNSAMHVRNGNAVMFKWIEVDTDSIPVENAKTSTTAWMANQKKLKEEGKNTEEVKKLLGPPSVHVINGWVKEMMKDMEPSMATKLQEKISTWKDWETIHQDFPVCKVAKCFNNKKKKIQLG
eukprot:163537-Karenia_brevis.AAC.1